MVCIFFFPLLKWLIISLFLSAGLYRSPFAADHPFHQRFVFRGDGKRASYRARERVERERAILMSFEAAEGGMENSKAGWFADQDFLNFISDQKGSSVSVLLEMPHSRANNFNDIAREQNGEKLWWEKENVCVVILVVQLRNTAGQALVDFYRQKCLN